jgi:threonine dehydrogenase-like Zn-dependent dehydrogenase
MYEGRTDMETGGRILNHENMGVIEVGKTSTRVVGDRVYFCFNVVAVL